MKITIDGETMESSPYSATANAQAERLPNHKIYWKALPGALILTSALMLPAAYEGVAPACSNLSAQFEVAMKRRVAGDEVVRLALRKRDEIRAKLQEERVADWEGLGDFEAECG